MRVIRIRDHHGNAGLLAGLLLVYSFVLGCAAIPIHAQSAAPPEKDSGGSSALWYDGQYLTGPGRKINNGLVVIQTK